MQRNLDRRGFESLLNEATRPSPLGTSAFDSMLGLSVRRWCAPVLDLDPLAAPDDYLTRRAELGYAEAAGRFLSRAGLRDLIVDTGYVPEPVSTPTELGTMARARAHQVVRLESTAEDLLAEGVSAADFGDRLVERMASSTAVGAKTVAAYRVGLALPATKPTEQALGGALSAVCQDHNGRPDRGGAYRVAHPVVHAYLAWTAIEVGLPLQIHVGFGDNDLNLHECDPLLLTGFLRATQGSGVPVLLLHNYPFHRQASYLAQVFDHVFMDVGLAVHNTGVLSRALIRESLEVVPFGKMLYSSDAFGLAELYYLGALLFRRGLATIVGSLIDRHEMGEADATRIFDLVGSANAERVYGLAVGSST
ncbi:MAG: amidohydrolase family protein [Nocardioidaceae bacterium]